MPSFIILAQTPDPITSVFTYSASRPKYPFLPVTRYFGRPSLPPLIRHWYLCRRHAWSRNCQAPSEAGLLQLWAVFMWLPGPPQSSSPPRIASGLGDDLCHPLAIHPLCIILLNKGATQPKELINVPFIVLLSSSFNP